MKITGNTILITGGSAGIGLELARKFLNLGNKVIITGRNKDRLDNAKALLGPNVEIIQGNVANEKDVNALVEEIKNKYADLNILINNAGLAYVYNMGKEGGVYEKVKAEMTTNFFAPINLIERLMPILCQQETAAIVNVTSVLALSLSVAVPSYSVTKHALRTYSLLLRSSLKNDDSIEVYDLMPPLVNTEFSKEIGGEENGIPPYEVADALVEAMKSRQFDVPVGLTKYLYDKQTPIEFIDA